MFKNKLLPWIILAAVLVYHFWKVNKLNKQLAVTVKAE